MAYLGLMALVFLLIGLAVLGEVIAVSLVVWSVAHLVQHRPAWYVRKILKGAFSGAVAAGALVIAVLQPWRSGSGDEALFLGTHLAAACFGYFGIAPARWYFDVRLDPTGPPL